MTSNQIIDIALLATGAILSYLGYQASLSLGEQMHETCAGRSTDPTTWYFVFGAVAVVAGLGPAPLTRIPENIFGAGHRLSILPIQPLRVVGSESQQGERFFLAGGTSSICIAGSRGLE